MIFIRTGTLWTGQFDRLIHEQRIVHGFSTRKGGISIPPFDTLNAGMNTPDNPEHILQNRQRFLDVLGLSDSQLALPRQVHGQRVIAVTKPGEIPDADALITGLVRIALTIQVADCVPVFLFDPGVPCIGLVHAGWRGTVEDISAGTVQAMQREYGSDPDNLLAFIGPSIGPCCYETGEEVRARFLSKYIRGKFLDLQVCNQDQLLSAGLQRKNIQNSGICTRCNSRLFFSHRASHGITGRMMAVIMLR